MPSTVGEHESEKCMLQGVFSEKRQPEPVRTARLRTLPKGGGGKVGRIFKSITYGGTPIRIEVFEAVGAFRSPFV